MLTYLLYLPYFSLVFARYHLDSVSFLHVHRQSNDFLVVIEWVVLPFLARALQR